MFVAALLSIVIWGATGGLFHFSDTWQLVINTSTTIVTFLMVFLIQNTQNRESAAVQLKLDELIRAVTQARGPVGHRIGAPTRGIQASSRAREPQRVQLSFRSGQ
jgi:low affinity Fe/Cu permease